MMFFFFTKAVFYTGAYGDAANELGVYTANLIEWNVINYEKRVNAEEEKMAEAVMDINRFKLSDMAVGFSITTTANMRMLFLSMPIARRGIGGVIPPETMPVTATAYRGY